MEYVEIATKICCVCRQQGTIVMSEADWATGSVLRIGGALIQDAFPTLNADEREQIISGTHPACWQSLFPKLEDEFEQLISEGPGYEE